MSLPTGPGLALLIDRGEGGAGRRDRVTCPVEDHRGKKVEDLDTLVIGVVPDPDEV